VKLVIRGQMTEVGSGNAEVGNRNGDYEVGSRNSGIGVEKTDLYKNKCQSYELLNS
jgi:hypothetical protein